MDELTPKQRSALQRAISNPELAWVLFGKAKGAKWIPEFAEAGFLRPADLPGPIGPDPKGYITVPNWPVAQFLANNFAELLEPQNRAAATLVYEFIVEVSSNAREREVHNYRVWWHFAKAIRGIPVDVIKVDDLWMADYWLSDPFEIGITADELSDFAVNMLMSEDPRGSAIAARLLDALFATSHNQTVGDDHPSLRLDNWYAERIGKKVCGPAVTKLGREFVDLLHRRLLDVMNISARDEWSSIWRPAIEDHEQNHMHTPQDILISLLRDAFVGMVRMDAEAGVQYAADLLGSTLQIARRIAIHGLRLEFEALAKMVDTVLSPSFFTANYRHEMWWLLHDRFASFSEGQRRCVLSIVTALSERDDNGKTEAGATAYSQAIWLAAIQDQPEIRPLYEGCVRIAGATPEQPDFSSYMTTGWVKHDTPISVEELRSLEVVELISRLMEYEEPQNRSFHDVGFEGLVKALRTVVKADPLKYSLSLERFGGLDLAFVYEVIEAYSELWRESVQLPWDTIWPSLLRFGLQLVSSRDYWSEENKRPHQGFVGNRRSVNGSLGRLVEAGCQKDEHAMPIECHGDARLLMTEILSREEAKSFSPGNDAVSIAINSPRGHCLEGMINLALRESRLADRGRQGHEKEWDPYKQYFENELSDPNANELVTLFVNYLSNFLYLDKGWTIQQLHSVFDRANYVRWSCAMQAYAYVSHVYPAIYIFLRDHGHFLAALDDKHCGNHVVDKIVQNIAVAYLHGDENIDDDCSLISVLIARCRMREMSAFVHYFWTLRDDSSLVSDISERILAFWVAVDRSLDFVEGQDAFSRDKLIPLIAFLPSLGSGFLNLVLRSVEAIQDSHGNHSYELLKGIARFSKREPLSAGRLWLKMLDKMDASYPEEAIRDSLVNLKKEGTEGLKLAKEVVGRYAKLGNLNPHAIAREIGAVARG